MIILCGATPTEESLHQLNTQLQCHSGEPDMTAALHRCHVNPAIKPSAATAGVSAVMTDCRVTLKPKRLICLNSPGNDAGWRTSGCVFPGTLSCCTFTTQLFLGAARFWGPRAMPTTTTTAPPQKKQFLPLSPHPGEGFLSAGWRTPRCYSASASRPPGCHSKRAASEQQVSRVKQHLSSRGKRLCKWEER